MPDNDKDKKVIQESTKFSSEKVVEPNEAKRPPQPKETDQE